MKKLIFAILGSAMIMTSCDLLNLNDSSGLSEDQVIEGLKTALNVGTDSASVNLSLKDGYYGNQLVKIPLPPQAEAARNKINSYPVLAGLSSELGLDALFEDVIKSVNRSAEDAAKEAAPIFKDAITGLTIQQGWDILHGVVPDDSASMKSGGFDSTAATKYLSLQTYEPLTNLFAPKINESLDKKFFGNYSAVETWDMLTSAYNNFISNSGTITAIQGIKLFNPSFSLPDEINTNLGEFSTQKALNGLFIKVGEQEISIRRDPWKWLTTAVGDILTKVFGSQD
jgi:hypothetical protein